MPTIWLEHPVRCSRQNNFRMLKKAVQQGRSEVRDAKNNERHVCGRARVGERPMFYSEAYAVSPIRPELLLAALTRSFVESLSDASTPLSDFSASC